MTEDRHSPIGSWHLAEAYALVAEKGMDVPHLRFHHPILHCFEQALELGMKAFLRAKGYSVEDVRKYGHNLGSLMDECKKSGIAEHWQGQQYLRRNH